MARVGETEKESKSKMYTNTSKYPQQKPFIQQIGSIWIYLMCCGCANVCESVYIRLVLCVNEV